jgi:hypothetical protein
MYYAGRRGTTRLVESNTSIQSFWRYGPGQRSCLRRSLISTFSGKSRSAKQVAPGSAGRAGAGPALEPREAYPPARSTALAGYVALPAAVTLSSAKKTCRCFAGPR